MLSLTKRAPEDGDGGEKKEQPVDSEAAKKAAEDAQRANEEKAKQEEEARRKEEEERKKQEEEKPLTADELRRKRLERLGGIVSPRVELTSACWPCDAHSPSQPRRAPLPRQRNLQPPPPPRPSPPLSVRRWECAVHQRTDTSTLCLPSPAVSSPLSTSPVAPVSALAQRTPATPSMGIPSGGTSFLGGTASSPGAATSPLGTSPLSRPRPTNAMDVDAAPLNEDDWRDQTLKFVFQVTLSHATVRLISSNIV